MSEVRLFQADTREAAMAAATVLIGATRGTGDGLTLAMIAGPLGDGGAFQWRALVRGSADQLAYLDSADLRSVGAAAVDAEGRLSVWTAAGFGGEGAAHG